MSLTFSISIFSPSKGNVSPYLGFLISKYLTIDMLLPLCLNSKPTPFLPLHRHTCTPILLSKNQTFPLANERHSVVKLRTMEWLLSVKLQREEKFHLSHLPSIHPSPHQSSLQLPYHNPRPNREIIFPPPPPAPRVPCSPPILKYPNWSSIPYSPFCTHLNYFPCLKNTFPSSRTPRLFSFKDVAIWEVFWLKNKI